MLNNLVLVYLWVGKKPHSVLLRVRKSLGRAWFFMLHTFLSQGWHNLWKGQVSFCEKIEGLALGYFNRKLHISPHQDSIHRYRS
jgi:hypothetical protein